MKDFVEVIDIYLNHENMLVVEKYGEQIKLGALKKLINLYELEFIIKTVVKRVVNPILLLLRLKCVNTKEVQSFRKLLV